MNGDCSTIERLPLRVLLIEDNPGDANLVRERLDGENSVYSACQHIACSCYVCPFFGRKRLEGEISVHYHIDWAATLEAGRERLAQGKTDLVLLDLSLPDSQGMDTFRTIRSLAPQLPVVILTGLDDQELAFQTIHEGGQAFWPSTRQPSITTGIPRRNSCGEASSTSISPSPSKLPQLGWRRMTGGRRYAPDTAARTGATWMWK
jgi:CheY-like chemotaxis protein